MSDSLWVKFVLENIDSIGLLLLWIIVIVLLIFLINLVLDGVMR